MDRTGRLAYRIEIMKPEELFVDIDKIPSSKMYSCEDFAPQICTLSTKLFLN